MANNQAVVQFQSGHNHLVEPVSVWEQGASLPASKVMDALRELKKRIRRQFNDDDDLIEKASDAIDVLHDRIVLTSRGGGVDGRELGQTSFKRQFSHDGKQFQIDMELIGYMR